MNFTGQQYLVIKALAEGIFPVTAQTPGASDLPVADIFVSITQGWEDDVFQATANALDVINDITLSIFSLPINKLDAQGLAYMVNLIANNEQLALFWQPFRILTALAYYSLPAAYESIGLPGPTIDKGGLTSEGYPV